MTQEKKKKILIDFAFVAVIILIVYLVFGYLIGYLLPFLIGLAISFAVQPLVRLLNRKAKVPKKVSAVVLVILTFALAGTLLGFAGAWLYGQIRSLIDFLTNNTQAITNAFSGLNMRLSEWLAGLQPEWAAAVSNFPSALVSWLGELVKSGVPAVANVASKAPSLLIAVIATVVASCFIAADYDAVVRFIKNQLSPKQREMMHETKQLFVKNIAKILRGYLLLMFITFLELLVGFLILGLEYAGALAALIAVIDILPILGTGTVLIPWAIIELLNGNLLIGIGLAVLYVVIAILRNFLEPKVIGRQIGLHPLLTLLAIFLGFKFFGFVGMVGFPLILIILINLQQNGKIHFWKTSGEAQQEHAIKND